MMTTPADNEDEYKSKVAGSLCGMLVGDAVAMPVHWYYSPTKMRADYGEEIAGMMAPLPNHPESMVQGMSYKGTLDIMHDKAQYYEGNDLALAAAARAEEAAAMKQKVEEMTAEEIAANRDDHGNYVGRKAEERVHYHASLLKGQNTANMCIARLAMRYLGEVNSEGDKYNPDEFLERLKTYMLTKPDPANDPDQILSHNDTYMDVYLRGFFTKASDPIRPLRECAMTQRDTWSIGSLDGVAMTIPIIAAYSNEPESFVLGRAVEHHYLTHRSITVTATISILVTILLDLYHSKTDLRTTLDNVMDKMNPPKITGRELADSYVNNKGPGNIPKHTKWLQHMEYDKSQTTKELIHKMIDESVDDEIVAGWRDQVSSRLSTACYCEQAFTIVLYLAYKYGPSDPRKALLVNAMLGGHSTSRGAVLGAILGAAYPGKVPFVDDLYAKVCIQKEIDTLTSTIQ